MTPCRRFGQHSRVTDGTSSAWPDLLDGRQFLDDQVDEALQFVACHVSSVRCTPPPRADLRSARALAALSRAHAALGLVLASPPRRARESIEKSSTMCRSLRSRLVDAVGTASSERLELVCLSVAKASDRAQSRDVSRSVFRRALVLSKVYASECASICDALRGLGGCR
jgi:hypothetical protein